MLTYVTFVVKALLAMGTVIVTYKLCMKEKEIIDVTFVANQRLSHERTFKIEHHISLRIIVLINKKLVWSRWSLLSWYVGGTF